MTTYSDASAAVNNVNGKLDEFGYHSHKMPDGSYSPMHNHMNGDVLHDHVVVYDPVTGKWEYDRLNDPILLANQQRLNAIYGGAVADPNASQQGINKICEEAAKEPEPPKKKSDIIWELLKGAAKQ